MIIIRKGRMAESVERNKFVASLIRIIAQKEQQLSVYRQGARQLPEVAHRHRQNRLSVTEGQTRLDLTSPSPQMKEVQALVANLQEQVSQLTQSLADQAAINAEYQRQVQDLQARERENEGRMAALLERVEREEGTGRQWREDAERAAVENGRLREQIERLRVQVEYERILEGKIQGLARKLHDCEKFQQRVRQNIDGIIRKHCQGAVIPLPVRGDEVSGKLAAIEYCLQQRATLCSRDCMLDNSLQEMLDLMDPLEEGLPESDWLADRKSTRGRVGSAERERISCDCESDNTTAFKENIHSH